MDLGRILLNATKKAGKFLGKTVSYRVKRASNKNTSSSKSKKSSSSLYERANNLKKQSTNQKITDAGRQVSAEKAKANAKNKMDKTSVNNLLHPGQTLQSQGGANTSLSSAKKSTDLAERFNRLNGSSLNLTSSDSSKDDEKSFTSVQNSTDNYSYFMDSVRRITGKENDYNALTQYLDSSLQLEYYGNSKGVTTSKQENEADIYLKVVYGSFQKSDFSSTAEYNKYIEDYKAWFNKNTKKTKNAASVTGYTVSFKDSITNPPVPEGTSLSTEAIQTAVYHCSGRVKITEIQNQIAAHDAEEIENMTASYDDTSADTTNSLLDVVRDAIDSASSGGGASGFLYTLQAGFMKYNAQYVLKPLYEGRLGILGNNTLVNLGETLDYASLGSKALLSSKSQIYAKGMGHTFSNQEGWVYSGGIQSQKKLLKLGANTALARVNTFDSNLWDSAEVAFNRLENKEQLEAMGLKDDFMKLYDEYCEARLNSEKGYGEAFKDAYTTKEHVDFDTGNLAIDTVAEMLVDPSLLIGGFTSGVSKGVIKGSVKASIKKGLKVAAKNGDELARIADVSDKLANKYIKSMGKKLYSRNSKNIQRGVNSMTDYLIKQGFISRDSKALMNKTMLDSIQSAQDTASWKIARSFHYTSRTLDAIDSAALKSVFIAPYTAFKLPKLGRKVIAKSDTLTKAFSRRSVEETVKARQALTRVEEVSGNYTCMDLDATADALGKEHIVTSDKSVSHEVYSEYVKKSKTDLYVFSELTQRMGIRVKNVEEGDRIINSYVENITDGKLHTMDELREQIETSAQKYIGRTDSLVEYFCNYAKIFEIYDSVKINIKRNQMAATIDYLKDLVAKGMTEDDLKEVIEPLRGDLPDKFIKGYDNIKNGIGGVRDYVQKYSYMLITDVKYLENEKYIENYNLFNGNVYHLNVRDDLAGKLSTAAADIKVIMEDFSEDEFKNIFGNGESLSFIYNIGTSKNINASVEGIKMHLTQLQGRLLFRKTSKVNMSLKEIKLLKDVDDAIKLINDKYLSTNLSDATEINRAMVDKCKVALEYLGSVDVQKTMSYITDTRTPLGKIIVEAEKYADNYSVYLDSSVNNFVNTLQSSGQLAKLRDLTGSAEDVRAFYESLKGTNVDEALEAAMIKTGITDPLEFIKMVKDRDSDSTFKIIQECLYLKEEAKSYEAFRELQEALKPMAGRDITEEESLVLLDTLFRFSSGNPDDFIRGGGDRIDEIIDNVQLNLESTYGNTRASTDGFTNEVLDFDGEMWAASKYAEEVQDPKVQEALKEFVSGGHVNPMDDVDKQMLMSIVKDPDGIRYYNELSEMQPVLFLDIETQGLNKQIHGISAVAMKEWKHIDENASLMEILDSIKKNEGFQEKTYLPEAELKEKIPSSVLELNYGKSLNIAPTREARMEQYLKDYGAEANGKVVTEQEVIRKLMDKLDDYYKGEKGSVKSEQVPVIVTHNNNGFDFKTICTRAAKVGEFPNRIKHLQDLGNKEISSLRKVKSACGDPLILNENRAYMKDAVYKYLKSINSYRYDMKVIHPNRFEQAMKNIQTESERLQNSDLAESLVGQKTRSKRISDDPFLGDFLNQVHDLSQSSDFENCINGMAKTIDDIKYVQSDFKHQIFYDPFNMSVKDLDNIETDGMVIFNDVEKAQIKEAIAANDEIAIKQWNDRLSERYLKATEGYEKQTIDNILKYQQRTSGDGAKIPNAGTKKLFSGKEAKACFSWNSGERITLSVSRNMQNFAHYVGTAVTKMLKDTTVIQGCKQDFDNVILFFKDYASQLTQFEDFSYFRYLRVPDTLEESYVMAQKIWDTFTFNGRYDEVMEYVKADVAYKDVPENLRNLVLAYKWLGKEIDIKSVVGDKALAILDDTGGVYRQQLFNNVSRKDLFDMDVDYLDDAKEFAAIWDDIEKNDVIDFENTVTRLEGISETADKRCLATQTALSKLVDVGRHVSAMTNQAKIVFKAESRKVVAKMFKEQTRQILDFVIKSEDNLLSHLLFNNQLLCVSLKGDDLHLKQIASLEDMLKTGVDHVTWEKDQNYIWIGIKREDVPSIKNDSGHVAEATEMSFKGESKTYVKPDYKRISVGENSFSDDYLNKMLRELEDDMDILTDGATRGSTGILYNLGRHTKMMNNLPPTFAKQVLTDATTCDARLWHQSSFDMSFIGDFDNRVKFGNETNLLLNYANTYHELVSVTKAERLYLDSFFNNSHFELGNFFEGEKPKDIIEAVNNAGYTAVVLKESEKNSTGFKVERVNLTDELSYKIAVEQKAILVPYDNYVYMAEAINDAKIDKKFFKIWTKYLAMIKVGQIMFTGTWVRNYGDATTKAAGDVGSLSKTIKCQMTAIKLIHEYSQINKFIDKCSDIEYRTTGEIAKYWDAIQAGTGCKMTQEQYNMLEAWFSNSASGGEAEAYKSILKSREHDGYVNNLLKDKNDFNRVGTNAQNFMDLPEETVSKFCDELTLDDFNRYGFNSKADFMNAFRGEVQLDKVRQFKFNQLCEEILDKNKMKGRTASQAFDARVDKVTNFLLTPMSYTEEVVRLGELLALADEGYSFAQCVKKITDSQFNYDLKSDRAKTLEMMIPFYNFSFNNAFYWCRSISENPRMVRYLESLWGPLTWESTEESNDDYVGNQSTWGLLNSGRVPIGKSGFYIKLNPSFLDAMNWLYNFPETLLTSVVSPIQPLLRSAGKAVGADSWNIWSDSVFWYDRNSDLPFHIRLLKDLAFNVPIAGSIYDRIDLLYMTQPWMNITGDGKAATAQKIFVGAMYSLFGAAYTYGSNKYDSYEEFQAALAEQGKWYDLNTRSVKSLSEKNTDYLNNPNLSWEEKQRYELIFNNSVWDANVGEFVDVDDFSGYVYLNDPSLSWEECEYYHEKLLGEYWDNNQGAWVTKDQYIEGGLNSDNLTFQQLQILQYAIHGKTYNYRTGEFEQTAEPIVKWPYDTASGSTGSDKSLSYQISDLLGLISYADTKLTDTGIPYGKYVLSGDAEHNAKVFEQLLSDFAGTFATNYSYYYSSGYAGGYYYNSARSYLPYTITSRPKNWSGVKDNRKYGEAYTYGARRSGLKMATSNNTSYDNYYQYNKEYNYNYQYKNPVVGTTMQPVTSVQVSRSKSPTRDQMGNTLLNYSRAGVKYSSYRHQMSVRQRLNDMNLMWYKH